jgi:hypothetical protein
MSKHTRGIDLKYRPSSYFWARDNHIPLISDIKGAERRKLYEQALEDGNTDLIDVLLTQPALSVEDRSAISGIHPAYMGGEYLPNTDGREVEIARITIASTTQDVTCVYAKQVGKRIHYRVVDEYDGDTLDGKGIRTSLQPLTLKQLVDFFLKTWNLIVCLDANFSDYGNERDDVQGFIVGASSSFYAEFGGLVRARVDEWLDTLPRHEEV